MHLNSSLARAALLAGLAWLVGPPARAAAAPAAPIDDAARFGELEQVRGADISPDGKRLVFVVPGPGTRTTAYVAELDTGQSHPVIAAEGKPWRLLHCSWASSKRIVCTQFGVVDAAGYSANFVTANRLFAIDIDGTQVRALGAPDSSTALTGRLYDGHIIDWLDGSTDSVLMAREYVPEMVTGRLSTRKTVGLGIDRLDTRSGVARPVEPPERMAAAFISDGSGNVRIKSLDLLDGNGMMLGRTTHLYRKKGEREWRPLGTLLREAGNETGMAPLAVDPTLDCAYVLQKVDGRWALYRVKLDGSLATELVLAQPDVDVEDVITAGRNGHVIGATWSREFSQVQYFDTDYRNLAAALGKAIPRLPLVQFMGASGDEQQLLLRASSDIDPGHYYTYDRKSHRLSEVALERPSLEGHALAAQKPIEYPAADGTRIPGYLTLPPGVTEAKGLPAIVMPHGGPASRDTWGFDWIVQFFAARGFAVLQPNYRGSAGFGDQWYRDSGFKGWRTAVGDVTDAGRWLVATGQADPAHLAIFGWSYGGYAALQAQVLAPGLFKATVAVAPVTDFGQLRDEARNFTSARLALDFIGNGAHIDEGSPSRHPGAFTAPVLMFHGDHDVNVNLNESKSMDTALRKAGKSSELVVYPGLDHQLPDGTVRADMLRRSDLFLRKALGIGGG
jgi:dipeptidyl aminopeptidase/acylaminoacyl peptidase